jgi:hypothetical protein
MSLYWLQGAPEKRTFGVSHSVTRVLERQVSKLLNPRPLFRPIFSNGILALAQRPI